MIKGFQYWYIEKGIRKKYTATERIYNDFFNPFINTKFKISPNIKVFAIGSCFARRLEDALLKSKKKVYSYTEKFNSFVKINFTEHHRGIMNKYNTYSMLYDIEWALYKNFNENFLINFNDNKYIDPFTHEKILDIMDKKNTLKVRKIINQVNKKIVKANLIVITLGLIEAWYDNELKMFLNITPNPRLLKKYKNRFEFRLISYNENLENLEKIYNILKKYNENSFKIIVTVSPVPLLRTFRKMDIVTANFYSKSVLRNVAEDWANLHDNIDYFPVFEMALYSDYNRVFRKDGRHIKDSFSNFVINKFLENYIEE